MHDEIEYLGMGYAYCDCHQLEEKCKLNKTSREKALLWNIPVGFASSNLPHSDGENDEPRQFLMETYKITELYQNEAACKELVEEACNLV